MVSSPNLRTVLREATAEAHARCEQAMDAVADVRSGRGYLSYLAIMQRLHHRYGAVMDRASHLVGLPAQSRNFRQALAADLGRGEPPSSPTAPPSDGYAVGVGYSLEGSTLGGAVLLKRVRKHHRDAVSSTFLELLATGREGRWRRYCGWMTTAAVDRDDAVAGAQAVFASLDHAAQACLAECYPE